MSVVNKGIGLGLALGNDGSRESGNIEHANFAG